MPQSILHHTASILSHRRNAYRTMAHPISVASHWRVRQMSADSASPVVRGALYTPGQKPRGSVDGP